MNLLFDTSSNRISATADLETTDGGTRSMAILIKLNAEQTKHLLDNPRDGVTFQTTDGAIFSRGVLIQRFVEGPD